MHAFMAAGLLRRPRFYSFNADSQAQPPDRELAQVKQGMGGSEGHAVGAADVGRQAALLKKPLKHSESIVFPGRRKSLTGEEKTAGMVGDRQRIAVLTIGEQELALVIGTPQFIWTLANGESGSLGPTTHAAAALDQAMTIQHRMDGALGRDRNSGESAQEAFANLAGTPARVLALHVQDEVFHLEGKLIRVAVGSSAPVRQPLHPAFLVAVEDLVTGLARDPKIPAEIRHWLARQPAGPELPPFIHHPTT